MLIGSTLESTAPGSQSANSAAGLEEDLNRFLNLLVTQLQNQDPLDPLDANEFTSQLVQFAGVEQQIFQNSNLEKLLALESANQVSAMVNFIGKEIQFLDHRLPLENGQAKFAYTMPAGAQQATINITNAAGLTVFQTEGDVNAGVHNFTWDGRNQSGITLPDGDYSVTVNALDFNGNLLDVEQSTFGRVNGAGVENGAAYLFVGENIVVAQENILAVKEPALPEEAEN